MINAMKEALLMIEAIEDCANCVTPFKKDRDKVIANLEQAIKEYEGAEPVGIVGCDGDCSFFGVLSNTLTFSVGDKLYTHPQGKLSDEDIKKVFVASTGITFEEYPQLLDFARAIEAKIKGANNGN